MSALESIRKRAKLLVIIIGASLLIFVLEDAFTSGKFFFGGGSNTIAVINGKKIDYTKFSTIADEAVEKEKASMATQTLRDSDEYVVRSNAFKDMVLNAILSPECNKLGINVPDSELTNLMIGPNPAPEVYRLFSDGRGHISKQFMDPRTGGLNMATVISYVKQMKDQDLARWELIEERVKNQDLQSKYFYLLINGLFVPDAIAKLDNDDASKTYNISYVLKRYTDMPDNSVTVSDQDIQDYYNKHIYEYYQPQELRKVDYVTFMVNPSDSDMINIHRDVDSMYSQFKNLKPSEDSGFIVATDAQGFDYEYHKADALPEVIDSIMTNSPVGTLYGPYKEGDKYKIAKLLDVAELPDSVKYSQIFIPAGANGDFDKVKPLVDSLKKVATVENFADLAKANSKDPELPQNGGDEGWVVRGRDLAGNPDLEHKMFFGGVGNVFQLQVQQGFIIICITDETKRIKSYKVGIAMKNIQPSTATQQRIFAMANDFADKNHTSDVFEKAAAQMNRRVVDINENDNTLEGMQTPKEFVKWAYDKKEGDVSDVITVADNKYVIAHVVQVLPMGTLPLEEVKEQVKAKVIEDKKAEKMVADMKSALSAGASLSSVAQKTGGSTASAEGLTFESNSIPTLGKEDAVIGTMSAMNTGSLSQPIQGQLGVYVIKVDSTYYTNRPDYRITQMKEQETLRGSAPNDAYNALTKKAGYVSHFGKYY